MKFENQVPWWQFWNKGPKAEMRRLNDLGFVAIQEGDYETALSYFEEIAYLTRKMTRIVCL